MSTTAPAGSTPQAPEVKRSGGSWLSGLGHSVFGWPLEEVVEALRSSVDATRIEAASRLHRAHGDVLPVAVGCLGDPVAVVRYHAIRTLMGSPEGREHLVGLLSGADERDAAIRASIIEDLANIHAPGSPFHVSWPFLTYTYTASDGTAASSNLFRDALAEARPGAALLPLLRASAKCGLMPPVVARWRRESRVVGTTAHELAARLLAGPEVVALETGQWPDRCCVCGAPGPKGHLELNYSGEVGRTPSGFNEVLVETVKGTLRPPACEKPECRKRPKVKVDADGMSVQFASPEFIADLIAAGSWWVPSAPAPKPQASKRSS